MADQLDLCFIRYSHRPAIFEAIFQDVPALPSGIRSLTYFSSHSLWPEYVVDAHGVQILTEEHLAKVNDLSAWSVQSIAPGRYLVESKDVDAWFAGPVPDAQTLAAAREDFGEMIVTSDRLLQEMRDHRQRARA